MGHNFPDDHNATPSVMDGDGSATVAGKLMALVLPVTRPVVAVINYFLPQKGEQDMNVFLKRLLQPGSLSGYGLIVAALMLFDIPEETANSLAAAAGPLIMAVLGALKIGMDDNKWL